MSEIFALVIIALLVVLLVLTIMAQITRMNIESKLIEIVLILRR